jgi:hypothetical protein
MRRKGGRATRQDVLCRKTSIGALAIAKRLPQPRQQRPESLASPTLSDGPISRIKQMPQVSPDSKQEGLPRRVEIGPFPL